MAMDQMYTDALKELEQVKAERDALAAHVERLEPLARRCLHLATAWNDHNHPAAHKMAEREAQSAGVNSRDVDSANAFLAQKPATSLARLIAEKQAEALDGVAMEWRRDEMDQNHTDCVEYVEKKAAALRRQAQEPST